MGLATQFATDLTNIETTDSDLAVSFTFGETTYTATGRTEVTEERDMEDAGFIQRKRLELVVREAAWGNDTQADKGDRITISGTNYKVEQRIPDQAGAATTFILVEDNSTAS